MLPDDSQPDPPDLGPLAEPAAYPKSATEPMPQASSKGDVDSAPADAPIPRKLTFVPAFRFVFENPDWFSTIVFSSVIGFLPVLGQIAQIGFYYDVVEALYRQPGAPYPKFEFRRFGDYCTRGVWPYVLTMMVGLLLYIFVWMPTQLTLQFGFIFLVNNTQVGLLILAFVAPVVLVGAMLILLTVATLTAPFMLRAGLAQDFRQIFRFDWCQGYVKRMWVQEVLTTLFVIAVSAILIPLGCCVFVYGAYAAGAIISLASANIRWQIYEIYLERGGEPIPLHPLPADPPSVVAPGPPA